MKNFKVIMSLIALITVSNAGAVVPTIAQTNIRAAINKIKRTPSNPKLTIAEKNTLNKYIPLAAKEAWVQKNVIDVLNQTNFDMDLLKKPVVAPKAAPAAKAVPVKKAAPIRRAAPVRTLTATQEAAAAKRAQATKDAAAMRKAGLTTATQQKPFKAILAEIDANKQLTAAQKAAISGPKTKTPHYKALLAELRPTFDLKTFTITKAAEATKTTAHYPTKGLTLNMAYAYDDATGLFTEEGIDALVENVRAKYPSLNKVRLITAAHDDAIEYLKGLRRGDGKGEILTQGEDNQLTSMINRVVLETETPSKSAPQYMPSAKRMVTGAAPVTTGYNEFKRIQSRLFKFTENGISSPWLTGAVTKLLEDNNSAENTLSAIMADVSVGAINYCKQARLNTEACTKYREMVATQVATAVDKQSGTTSATEMLMLEAKPEEFSITPAGLKILEEIKQQKQQPTGEKEVEEVYSPAVKAEALETLQQEKQQKLGLPQAAEQAKSMKETTGSLLESVLQQEKQKKLGLPQAAEQKKQPIAPLPPKKPMAEEPSPTPKKLPEEPIDTRKIQVQPTELTPEKPVITPLEPKNLAEYKIATLQDPSIFYKVSSTPLMSGLQQRWFNEAVRITKQDPAHSKAIGFEIFNMIFPLATEIRDELSKEGTIPQDITDEDITTMTMEGIQFAEPKEEQQPPVEKKKVASIRKQTMDELLLMLEPQPKTKVSASIEKKKVASVRKQRSTLSKTRSTKVSAPPKPKTLAEYKIATLQNPSTFYKVSSMTLDSGLQQRWFNEAARIAKQDPANKGVTGFDILNMVSGLATELKDELSKKGTISEDINDDDIAAMTMAGIEF